MPRREHRERANSERVPGKAPAQPRSRDSKRPPRLDATHVAGITSLMNPTNMTQGLNLDSAEQDVMGRDPPQNTRKHATRDPVELFTKELEELSRDLGIELNDEGFGGGPPSPSAESEPEKNTARPRIPASSSRGPASSAQIGALIEDLGLGSGGGSGHKTRTSADKSRGHRGSSSRRPVASSEESSDRGSDYGSEGSRRSGSEDESESGSSYGSGSQSGSGSDYSGSETESESGSGSEHSGSGSDYSSDASEYSKSSGGSRGSKSSAGSAASGSTGASWGSGSSSAGRRRHKRGRKGRKSRETADESVDRVLAKFEKDFGLDTRGWQKDRTRHIHKTEGSGSRHGADGGRAPEMTEEQQRRAHINSVVADMRKETRTTFGVEKERIQDEKATKLEQIAQLKLVLEEEGYKCDKVGSPTLESSMEEIDGVLAVLRLRNDRNRYSSLAEEIFVGGAEMLETVCDGTRAMPIIGWKPDYTGYSQTVAVKLHRMRFETAQVVGTIIEKFRIGSVARIVLELLPSIFLYPRQQKRQRGTPGLYDDPKIADARGAVTAIRASDDRKKSLHEVSNL